VSDNAENANAETTPFEADAERAQSDGTPDAASSEAAPLTPEQVEELKRKAEESDEYLDLLKRTKADFANYQKRVEEDRRRWSQNAQREVLANLLMTADQCRVAAEKSATDESVESLRGALSLLWSELEKFLASFGVKAVDATGAEFDPAKHQAVHVIERDDVPDSTVIEEIVRGYEFNGQVLRTAQVVVSKKPKPPEPPPAAETGSGEDEAQPRSPDERPAADAPDEGPSSTE